MITLQMGSLRGKKMITLKQITLLVAILMGSNAVASIPASYERLFQEQENHIKSLESQLDGISRELSKEKSTSAELSQLREKHKGLTYSYDKLNVLKDRIEKDLSKERDQLADLKKYYSLEQKESDIREKRMLKTSSKVAETLDIREDRIRQLEKKVLALTDELKGSQSKYAHLAKNHQAKSTIVDRERSSFREEFESLQKELSKTHQLASVKSQELENSIRETSKLSTELERTKSLLSATRKEADSTFKIRINSLVKKLETSQSEAAKQLSLRRDAEQAAERFKSELLSTGTILSSTSKSKDAALRERAELKKAMAEQIREYQNNEILLKTEIEEFEAQLKDLRANRESLVGENQELVRTITGLEDSLKITNQKISSNENNVSDLKSELASTTKLLESTAASRKVIFDDKAKFKRIMADALKDHEMRGIESKEEVAKLKEKLELASQENQYLTDNKNRIEKQLGELDKLMVLKGKLADQKEVIASKNKNINELVQENEAYSSKLAQLQKQLEKDQERISILAGRGEEINKENSTLKAELDQISSTLSKVNNSNTKLDLEKMALSKLTSDLSLKNREFETLEREQKERIEGMSTELHTTKNNLEFTAMENEKARRDLLGLDQELRATKQNLDLAIQSRDSFQREYNGLQSILGDISGKQTGLSLELELAKKENEHLSHTNRGLQYKLEETNKFVSGNKKVGDFLTTIDDLQKKNISSNNESKLLKRRVKSLQANNQNLQIAAEKGMENLRYAFAKLEQEGLVMASQKDGLHEELAGLENLIKDAINDQGKVYNEHVSELSNNIKNREGAIESLRKTLSSTNHKSEKYKGEKNSELAALSEELDTLRVRLAQAHEYLIAQDKAVKKTAELFGQKHEDALKQAKTNSLLLSQKDSSITTLTAEIKKRTDSMLTMQHKTKVLLSSLGFEEGKSKDAQKVDFLKMVAERELNNLSFDELHRGQSKISKGLASILDDSRVVGGMLSDLGQTSIARVQAKGALDSNIYKNDGAKKCGTLYKLFLAKRALNPDRQTQSRDLEPLFGRYASIASKQLGRESIARVNLSDLDDLQNPLAQALMY
jgi:chromosome segregation ATPase